MLLYMHIYVCIYILYIYIYIYIILAYCCTYAICIYVYIYIYIYIIVYILFVHLEYVHLLNSVLFDIDIGIFKFFNLLVSLFILWRRVSSSVAGLFVILIMYTPETRLLFTSRSPLNKALLFRLKFPGSLKERISAFLYPISGFPRFPDFRISGFPISDFRFLPISVAMDDVIERLKLQVIQLVMSILLLLHHLFNY